MNRFAVKSKGPNGQPTEAGPMEMREALKQARQLAMGGHIEVVLRDDETGVETPIDEFDELD